MKTAKWQEARNMDTNFFPIKQKRNMNMIDVAFVIS